jgi:hypothetical protein
MQFLLLSKDHNFWQKNDFHPLMLACMNKKPQLDNFLWNHIMEFFIKIWNGTIIYIQYITKYFIKFGKGASTQSWAILVPLSHLFFKKYYWNI